MKYPFIDVLPRIAHDEKGLSNSFQAVSYNEPKAVQIRPNFNFTCTGINVWCSVSDTKYSHRLGIQKAGWLGKPDGFYLSYCQFGHFPAKSIFPHWGYFFFPIPPVRLQKNVLYCIVAYGDPTYPSEVSFRWSWYPGYLTWNNPAEKGLYGQRLPGLVWTKYWDRTMQYQLYQHSGYYPTCE